MFIIERGMDLGKLFKYPHEKAYYTDVTNGYWIRYIKMQII